MTAVAQRTGRVADGVRAPLLVRHVPLRRQREIVVTGLPEVPLLPLAAIHERDLILAERDERVGLAEVSDDRLRMLARVAHNVRHPRLLPSIEDGRVAAAARG